AALRHPFTQFTPRDPVVSLRVVALDKVDQGRGLNAELNQAADLRPPSDDQWNVGVAAIENVHRFVVEAVHDHAICGALTCADYLAGTPLVSEPAAEEAQGASLLAVSRSDYRIKRQRPADD